MDGLVVNRPPLAARALRQVSPWIRLKTLPLARWAFARVGSPFIVCRPFLGYQLVLDVSRTDTHRLLFVEGERFVTERALIASLVRPHSSIVDVGANIGYFMLFCQASSGGTAKMLCLEPEPSNFEELQRNVSCNGFESVAVRNVAASDIDSTVRLTSGLNGVVGLGGELEVQAFRLDSMIDEPVDLVKIDVEGHEAHVLRGAEQLLAKHHPTMLVEVHPELIHSPYQVKDVLAILRRHYPDIRAHLLRTRGPLHERLRARYVPARAVDSAVDPGLVVTRCEQGLQRDPFWLTART